MPRNWLSILLTREQLRPAHGFGKQACGGVAGLPDHDCEFLSAGARYNVVFPGEGGDFGGYRFQNMIAGNLIEFVTYRFETVDAGHYKYERAAGIAGILSE